MAAELRIYSHPNLQPALGEAAPAPDEWKKYTERLVKLIPGEIVGLYLAGKVAIAGYFPKGTTVNPSGFLTENSAWISWSVICFILVILVRRWAPVADRPNT